MKLAFLAPSLERRDDVARAVATQAGALGRDHAVRMLSPGAPAERRVDVDRRVSVDERADLERELPRLKVDVVVTTTPALCATALRLVRPGTAVVHWDLPSPKPRWLPEPLDADRWPDVVVTPTATASAWWADAVDGPAPVVTVPTALPTAVRPRSPLTEPVVVAPGRLVGDRQLPQVVAAFARVADRIPEWRLRIVGEGPARAEILGAVRKRGLTERVELVRGDDLPAALAGGSIAVQAAALDGDPVLLQAAMAAGLAVVAFDGPTGPRAVIDDGVDGLLVTTGSEPALAAGLLRLATDPAERARLGSAALAASAAWETAAVTDRWAAVLREAVNRRGAGARVAATTAHPDVAPVGREGTGTTPEQARTAALAAAVDAATTACRDAGVGADWFVVPPHGEARETTVVLPVTARRGFLAALASADLPPYLSLHDPEQRGWPARRGVPAVLAEPLLRGRTGRLLLEPWPGTDGVLGSATPIGRDCGVAVEFWEQGPDGDLHAPAPAVFTRVAPPAAATTTTRVHDVDVPTHPMMAGLTPSDRPFEIDVVYTWVDGDDAAWNDAREARLAEVTDTTMQTRASSGRARFMDRGELRYSLRSLHLFAPWVRRIHLVTAGQVPDWLDPDDPRINVVDHRDLLPPEALPTFNSHAIESVLHRIEGLAEHFLYFNDDFFVGAPTWPERWFSPTGQCAVFLSPGLVGLPGQDVLPYQKAAATNRRLLAEAFGVTTLNTLAHAPYAHRVSTLREIAERFAPEVDATTHAPFRSTTDVSMLSSLGQHYGLMTGGAYLAEADFAFVDITDFSVTRRLRELGRRRRAGFCLGDSHDFALDPDDVDRAVVEFLETYYPIAAPWERG